MEIMIKEKRTTTADVLRNWLNAHKEFNALVIAVKIGWNSSSMGMWLRYERGIPEKHEIELTKFLIKYQYPFSDTMLKLCLEILEKSTIVIKQFIQSAVKTNAK